MRANPQALNTRSDSVYYGNGTQNESRQQHGAAQHLSALMHMRSAGRAVSHIAEALEPTSLTLHKCGSISHHGTAAALVRGIT